MTDVNNKSIELGGLNIRTYYVMGTLVQTNLTSQDIKRRPERGFYKANSEMNGEGADNPGRVYFKTDNEALAFCHRVRKQ